MGIARLLLATAVLGLGGRVLAAEPSATMSEVFGGLMKIQCISNSTSALPPALAKVITSDTGQISAIEPGKDFRVYALATYKGHVWFYIADEACLNFPVWKPAVFFKIVDSRASSCWRVNVEDGDLVVAFKEWAADPTYYDALSDGDAGAVALFQKYKELMDNEFVEGL